MFDKIFGVIEKGGKKTAAKRAIRSPMMNLAYMKVPTLVGTWATSPVGRSLLTDERYLTHFSTDGVTTTNASNKVEIKFDLGQIFEVYSINIMNTSGAGIKASNASSTGTVKLQTSVDGSTWTTRATQTPAGITFEDMDINYDGEGVAVRYVRLYLENDGTYSLTIDIAEVEIFGC
jgi:hypothetical protein